MVIFMEVERNAASKLYSHVLWELELNQKDLMQTSYSRIY